MITVRHLPIKIPKAIPGRFVLTALVTLPALLILAFITDKIILDREHYLDQLIFSQLADIASRPMTHLMVVVNFFGSSYFLIPAYSLLILFYAVLAKDRSQSRTLAATGLAGVLILWALTTIFHHPPPTDPMKLSGFGFPGGHPFLLFTFFGLLIYITWNQRITLPFKGVVTGFLLLIVSAIALSRIYLHINYASDVVAGLCLCVIWLGVSIWLANRKRGEPGLLYTH